MVQSCHQFVISRTSSSSRWISVVVFDLPESWLINFQPRSTVTLFKVSYFIRIEILFLVLDCVLFFALIPKVSITAGKSLLTSNNHLFNRFRHPRFIVTVRLDCLQGKKVSSFFQRYIASAVCCSM